jgi:predicted O-methyltransferase YrrM
MNNYFQRPFALYLALLLSTFTITTIDTQLHTIRHFLRNFGGWSIDKELFDFIRSVLPEGKIMLELGSGWSSQKFSEYYTVYSIEHNEKWVGKYSTHYIYAPIKNGWYDISILSKKLPQSYDLILIDGPTGDIGRGGFYSHLDLFNTNVIMIFDDINRKRLPKN